MFFRSEQLVRGSHVAVGPFRKRGDHTTTCSRAIVNGELLESLSYTRNQNRNNFTVRTSAGFALIDHFSFSAATASAANDPEGDFLCSVRFLDPVAFSGSSFCPTIKAFTPQEATERDLGPATSYKALW